MRPRSKRSCASTISACIASRWASSATRTMPKTYSRTATVRAFEKRASFAGRNGIGAWLASIVRNQAIDCLRSRRSRRSAYTLEADLPLHGRGIAVVHRKRAGSGHVREVRSSASSAGKPAPLSKARSCPCPCPSAPYSCCAKSRACRSSRPPDYLDIPVATVKTRAHRARLLLRAQLGGGIPRRVAALLRVPPRALRSHRLARPGATRAAVVVR